MARHRRCLVQAILRAHRAACLSLRVRVSLVTAQVNARPVHWAFGSRQLVRVCALLVQQMQTPRRSGRQHGQIACVFPDMKASMARAVRLALLAIGSPRLDSRRAWLVSSTPTQPGLPLSRHQRVSACPGTKAAMACVLHVTQRRTNRHCRLLRVWRVLPIR